MIIVEVIFKYWYNWREREGVRMKKEGERESERVRQGSILLDSGIQSYCNLITSPVS